MKSRHQTPNSYASQPAPLADRITAGYATSPHETQKETHPRPGRKRTEQEAAHLLDFMRAIIGNLGEGTYAVDRAGQVTFMNPAAERMLGWTEGELLGQDMHKTIHFQRADGAPFPMEQCPLLGVIRSGEAVRVDEDLFTRKDGVTISVAYVSSPLRADGVVMGAVVAFHEIGGRKQLEAALRRSEQEAAARASQLSAIFESMADSVLFYDGNGRFVQANRAFRDLLALDARPDYASLPLHERGQLLAPRDENGQPLPYEQWLPSRVLRGEVLTGTNAVDFLIRTLDGREVLLNGSGAPVRDTNDKIVGCVLILRDVTQRRGLERQVAAAARESAARASQLEAILDTVADGVLVFDREGRILHTNHADTEFLRFDLRAEGSPRTLRERGELIDLRDERGQPLPKEQWPAFRVLRGELLRGAGAMDTRARTLDGRDILVNTSGAPVRDAEGHIAGGVLIVRDVTDRRQLERQTHEALDALLSMAETLVSDDPSPTPERGPATTAGVAQRLAGLTQSVLGCQRVTIVPVGTQDDVQQTWAVAGLIPDEERQQWQASWPRPDQRHLRDFLPPAMISRLQLGELIPVDRWQAPFNRWPNPLAWRSMLLVPMLLGRQLVGVLTLDYGPVARAFTPDELALTSGIARLVALVLERERLLREREEARASAMAMREANRRMDEFLGIATHELKTPVTSSSLCVELANDSLKHVIAELAADGDAVTRTLEPIQALMVQADSGIERLSRLMDDLLDVSRIRAGRLEFRLARCDLAEVVRDAVAEQRLITPHRTIHLRLPATASVPAFADADRIRQVVTNYLVNALKYSQHDQDVRVRLDVKGLWARVSVCDQGPGLAADEQQRVWERFHRAAGVQIRDGTREGLGLGLYLCRTIIERHHGRIGVRSAPGQGSTFWFALPVERADA